MPLIYICRAVGIDSGILEVVAVMYHVPEAAVQLMVSKRYGT